MWQLFLYKLRVGASGADMFSKRIRNVQPSGTVMLSNKVKRLMDQGLDILSFTLGEPDFSTPPHIIEAAKEAPSGMNAQPWHFIITETSERKRDSRPLRGGRKEIL